ncbi:hypothetical protein [Novacetimonas pomaceti]|uniref:hypothetical protein n=1 Tax=Novacetimonas pomaceti TaxID=2021998 RepID=UPI0014034271|nr:hypothetical protein [Novacetimonas pomaceti]
MNLLLTGQGGWREIHQSRFVRDHEQQISKDGLIESDERLPPGSRSSSGLLPL